MFILLTGSAGSGKSAVLQELSSRNSDLFIYDMDDLRPPKRADSNWWHNQLEKIVQKVISAQNDDKYAVLAGWTNPDEVFALPSSAKLKDFIPILLDCNDSVRRQRIQKRVDTGNWVTHTNEEIESYLQAAKDMRQNAPVSTFKLDTSNMSITQVADQVESLIKERKA